MLGSMLICSKVEVLRRQSSATCERQTKASRWSGLEEGLPQFSGK